MEPVEAHIDLSWELGVAVAAVIIPVMGVIWGVSLKFTRVIATKLTGIDVRLGSIDTHNEAAHSRLEKKVCAQNAQNAQQWASIGRHGERLASLEMQCKESFRE